MAFGQNVGPGTTTAPYVVPNPALGSAIATTSILTVGDVIGGYRMLGIPDGLGAFSTGTPNAFDLVMNHEFNAGSGPVHANGSAGSFVSRWTIDSSLNVLAGRDHNTAPSDVHTWDGVGYVAGPAEFSRFCSADLAAPSAFRFGNFGTDSRIFLTGEENGNEGRVMAHVTTGSAANQSWQLPALGRFSHENVVASPFAQRSTVVAGMDDSSTNGQVYFYVGQKSDTGNDIERAGLTGGNLYGLRVSGLTGENRSAPPAPGARFDLFDQGNVTNSTGAALDSASAGAGVTSFLRPEDGAWDPRPGHENDFYFVTTDRFNSQSQTGRSRLWHVAFDDISNPTAGGTIDAVLDGTEGGNMFDNICIDTHGRILIQEDIGGNDPLGKIWLYDIGTDLLTEVAAHSADFFLPGGPGFLTTDEESSGIIDAKDFLGDGYFLFDVQAHYDAGSELIEGGQLLALYVDPSFVPGPSVMTLLGLGGLAACPRRRR
jgi:hypothetical protein